MKSYYIKYLSEDQKELLSKKVNLDEVADYDVLLMHSEDYFDIKKKLDMSKVKEILDV